MLVMSRHGIKGTPRSLEQVRDELTSDLEALPPQSPRVPILRRFITGVEVEIARRATQRSGLVGAGFPSRNCIVGG